MPSFVILFVKYNIHEIDLGHKPHAKAHGNALVAMG
jgi:hypothetical protein